MLATCVAVVELQFRRQPGWQMFYQMLGLVSALRLMRYRSRPRRRWSFLGLAVATFLPIFHGHEADEAAVCHSLLRNHLLGLGAAHVAGGILCAARVPERLWPNKFDIYGNSHQWTHALVLVGASVFARGLAASSKCWVERDKCR